MSYIGPITRDLIDTIIKEFKKKENREKVSTYIIDPVVKEVLKILYPYFGIYLLVQVLTIVLLVYIIFNMKNNS
jgi:flagellar biosynthesis protein FlhB